MPDHPYYKTAEWRRLSALCLKRDNYRCATPHCRTRATMADHIVPRRKGGPDTLSNLRSLCPSCHSRITRKGNVGELSLPGCDASGRPLAHDHPWNARQAH